MVSEHRPRTAVSDTSSLNYLILIEEEGILPALFDRVFVPEAVARELQHETESPAAVKEWIRSPPDWLVIRHVAISEPLPERLHNGEHEAILLAEELHAGYLLLDDKWARREAHQRGLPVVGLIGILEKADERGWIDLPETLERLKLTTFRGSPELYESAIERSANRKRDPG